MNHSQYSDERSRDEDHDPQFEPRDAQKLLLKSFLVVMLCYTIFIFGIVIVGSIVFNDAFLAMGNLEPEEFDALLAKDSAALFPRARYLPFIALATLLCMFLGWLIVQLAPFSKMVHSVFLVLLVAATCFTIATGDKAPAELQTLAIALVGLGPIGIVIGARVAMSRIGSVSIDDAQLNSIASDSDER